MWQVGVDVGGTFTNVFASEAESGRYVSHKVPSTPEDPLIAIGNALSLLEERFGVNVPAIQQFCHGITGATNALIQRKGGKIALITTKGFRDLLTIGRQVRPLIYDLQADYPDPLIPVELRLEVDERIGSKGEVLTPLGEDEIGRVADEAAGLEPDGVAICLLFAFLNADHERRIRTVLEDRLPGVFMSTSHEVQPVFREYERFSTTVLNTYLQPVMSQYIQSVEGIVNAAAPSAQIGINQSSGGLMAVEQAARFPVRTALSDPAAGGLHAIEVAEALGLTEVLVPPDPGILCARGLMVADRSEVFVATRRTASTLIWPCLNLCVNNLNQKVKTGCQHMAGKEHPNCAPTYALLARTMSFLLIFQIISNG